MLIAVLLAFISTDIKQKSAVEVFWMGRGKSQQSLLDDLCIGKYCIRNYPQKFI